jgi:soluble lytic murein transglycosylase-like protein
MHLAPLALIALVLVASIYVATKSTSSGSNSGDVAASAGDAAAAPGAVAGAFGVGEDLAVALGRTIGKLWSPPAAAAPYVSAIAQAESKYGLPANLLARQLDIESNHFDPQVIDGTVKSRAGAIGIAQFMPATAAERSLDPTNPWRSIDQAAADVRAMYDKFGSWAAALAAYNWGQGNVSRKGLGSAPLETREYIAAILRPLGLS